MTKERRTPVATGTADKMPEPGARPGFWSEQYEQVLSKNPGVIYTYGDVSESTASNLRRDYGLTCATSKVNGELVLYVKWVPEDADKIKQDTLARGAKRRATMAARKANGESGKPAPAQAPSTGKATAGTRS